MLGRSLLMSVSLVLLLAHLTGTMGTLISLFQVDIEPSKLIYLALLPLVGLFSIYLMSDGR